MNNSINTANSNAPKSSDPIVPANTKSTQDRANSAETNGSGVTAGSFHESIKKAYDESKNSAESDNTDKNDTEQGGNNLPVSTNAAQETAQDDLPALPGGLYLSSQTSSDNKRLKSDSTQTSSLTAKIDVDSRPENASDSSLSSPATDKKVGDAGKLSEIPSQLRQLLATEKDSNSKNTKSGLIRNANGSTDTLSKSTDNTPVLSSESLTLKTESAATTSDKVSASINMTGQQPSLANTSSSILLQAATAQSDTAGNALPLSSTPATSANQSNTTFQPTLPPAGITEAFGRPAWAQGMGKQILMMVNQNISTAEIRLNPSNLGPIEMLIDMKDEQVSVSMSSRHVAVREAMEQALPKLRDMLEQNGFSLAGTDISQHSFAQQREQNSQSTSKGFAVGNNEQQISSDVSQQVMRQTATASGMVDYYI